MQQKDHYIDGKKIEAKAAVPKNSGNAPTLTRKMFVGGTVSLSSQCMLLQLQEDSGLDEASPK